MKNKSVQLILILVFIALAVALFFLPDSSNHRLPQEIIAFFIEKSNSVFFANEAQHFKIILVLFLLLLGMILTTFYLQYSKRKEIIEANKRLELVIEGARLATWDWNIQTGEVLFNDRWAKILGYEPDEIKPHVSSWEKIIHPDEREMVNHVLTEHLEGRTSGYITEHRLRHKSGKWIWILDVGKVFERDEKGRPLRAVGIHLDINDTKRVELALEKSNNQMEHYLAAIENIGMGLIVIDPDYRVRDMNRTMINWFGDQIGRICYEYVAGQQGPCAHCRLGEVIEGGNIVKYTWVIDGRSFDSIASPIANQEGGISKMEIIQDITDQEQAKTELLEVNRQLEAAILVTKEMAEKSDAANQAKSAFLANMSHELRTPLNAILGYTQIFARDSTLTPQQQSGIKTMHQSGEHLLMLINDVLDLSKIEANKMELVLTEFTLPEFLRDVMDIIRGKAIKKRLQFLYEPDRNLPILIEADELRLRQVLLNLLSNAVKFTRHGQCTLRVMSQAVAMDRALLTFVVEDTGAGILPEMQEKVFDPFQQTGDRLQYAEGSGLGLAISRKLVHFMGGKLQLISPANEQPTADEGPGCRFIFTVSVRVAVPVGENIQEQINREQEMLIVPPRKVLKELNRMIRLGDIDSIVGEAEKLAVMESGKYLAFTRRIKQMADDFQLMDLEEFVARHQKES